MSPQTPTGVEAKLDEIIDHLRRMDKRDRARMWGSTVRSVIHLIPIIILLWSLWFAYAHWDELLKQFARTAAEQSAEVMKQGSSNIGSSLQEELNKLFPQR